MLKEDLQHFSEMRKSYAALLRSILLDEHQDSLGAIESSLGKLFYDSYIKVHSRRELANVDRVEFLGGFYLLDSQGCCAPDAASRVIGAIGVSQEAQTLKKLLTLLRADYQAGQQTEKTLELIRAALLGAENAASLKKRRSLRRAISAALRVDRKGLVQLFEYIVSETTYFSPLSYNAASNLRELSSLIAESLRDEGIAVKLPRPRRGHPLPKDFWDRLRELVQVANGSLAENQKKYLVEMLGGFYPSGYKELLKSLASPSDELLELVEQWVCPIVDDGRGRPRDNLSQRRLRFKNSTKYQYDIGHFLPHSAGGPADINLFVQERRLNRGWSEQGKRYRWLENMVFSRPGTLFFVRPVYVDLSPIPVYLEWGMLLDEVLFETIREDIECIPELQLVIPVVGEASTPNLMWLVSVFENFNENAIQEMRASAGWIDGL